MNGVAKGGVIGACVILLGAGGFGAYNIVHGLTETVSAKSGPAATAVSTVPPTGADAVKRAQSFLDSWHVNHYAGAADQTNDPGDAQTALTDYGTGLGLTGIAFSDVAASTQPGPNATTTVSFTVNAQVKGGTWSYPGSLQVLQSVGGSTSVEWSPSVLFPALKRGQTLAAGPIPASAETVSVTDAKGVVLTAAKFPSLASIISTIAASGATTGGDGGGTGVEVVDTATSQSVSTAKVFSKGKGATITTTLDAGIQARAEAAVRNPGLHSLPASTVAIDWKTGHILAVAYANTGADGNVALMGGLAPGSTMKIITAAALFDKAGMNPSTAAPCPVQVIAASSLFKNDFTEEHPSDTIRTAFARSCNTAFIKLGFKNLVHKGTETADLGDEATNVFGLGKQNGGWSIGGGVATTDASVPADPSSATAAADLIGQGDVTMNPLALASMAATVRNAGFLQPIILPKQKQVPAARPISGDTARNLQKLMSAAAHESEGTAAGLFSGYPGVGAKTGTSEVGSSKVTTNGWFSAYNGSIAVGALVQGGSTGAGTAGVIAKALLTAG